jgi:apolipoprotein N-acyltransferase
MTPRAAPETTTDWAGVSNLRDTFARHQVIAGAVSGLLLWTAFPPLRWNWLAWVALAPLFWLATIQPVRPGTYLAAWAGGLVFWFTAISWLRMSDSSALLGWLTMALVLSFWWPAFLALARWAVFRLRLPLMLAAPLIWVGLEYARAHLLSGFPWYYLAHSQFRSLYLIQIADFSSSLGISLLIALTNACLVDLLTLPLFRRTRAGGARFCARQYVRVAVVAWLLLGTLGYGVFRITTARFHDGPKLALLQSNIEQRHKMRGDPATIVRDFENLIVRALSRRERPDLIVWPETAYPFGFISIDPAVGLETLGQQVRAISPVLSVREWVEKQEAINQALHSWTNQAGVPMLVGSIFYDHKPGSMDKYNSAILFEPHRAAIRFYHKMHLVPFGEYVPFIGSMPWLTALTPYRGERIPSLSFGRQPISLPLGRYRLAVSVCFEDTIPQVIGRFFQVEPDGHQPDVLINLSNDGWFRGSPELEMHLAIGVFRAIEHRVPLARAVNTGLSALVDGNGEIRDALAQNADGVLSVTVPLDDRTTWYSRWGDWLGLSCFAVSIGLVPLGLFRRTKPEF